MNFYDFSLCRSIVRAGAQATLYTCDETAVATDESFPVRLTYRSIYGTGNGWMRGLRFLRGSLQALPGARWGGHQLAHFHFFHVGPLELFNVMLARLVGLRVVITAHDVEALKDGLSIPLFVRWVYEAAHRIIAHSHIARRELIQELNVADTKIDVIPHGNYVASVPEDLTQAKARMHFGFTSGQRVLLFFGQIKDVKGLDVLLEGFALARAKDVSLHLLIGGRVWKTDFAKYQDAIDKHGLTPFCTLHIRYIPDEEVAYFYRCADLVVLPYLRIYQSGVVLLAMSYGNPVLVSDIEGMLEAVEDEQTGFVFRSRDPGHLAKRLNEIFATPGHAAAVARAGHQTVTVRNDWGNLGKQTLACYRRALHARKST